MFGWLRNAIVQQDGFYCVDGHPLFHNATNLTLVQYEERKPHPAYELGQLFGLQLGKTKEIRITPDRKGEWGHTFCYSDVKKINSLSGAYNAFQFDCGEETQNGKFTGWAIRVRCQAGAGFKVFQYNPGCGTWGALPLLDYFRITDKGSGRFRIDDADFSAEFQIGYYGDQRSNAFPVKGGW